MAYDHKLVEEKWQKKWEEWGVYRFDPESDKPIYSIDTPPPTVSGAMHLGHAFSYSQMDFIARYKRMRGHNLFYPFGTDDNGLPTERLVESLNGVKATEMDRGEFIKLCLSTLEKIRPEFVQGWKDIGISADWTLNYSTIDEHCRRISQKSFLDLYEMGREYRKENPFVWCPTCQTAIAQVEMEDREISSSFNDIVFKLEDGSSLVIATTRPEMLPACVAIFAHPEDERYKDLFGKKARVPVFDFEVPILPDEKADPEKGTGIVMCCTFGDMTDIEWYLEHDLPLKEAITKDGRMTELAGKYQGMTIKEARERIIQDMEDAGLLVGSQDISHHVNVHERCGTEIEILNTKQWFIRYLDLKEEFLKAGREIEWFPDHMRNRYDNWVHGLRWDWCISRQRYFGVPFPVWYCKGCGEIKLARQEDLPVDPLADSPKTPCKCGSTEFAPEKDVLDTWATSSLTPDLAIQLVEDPEVRKRLYPMSLRPQAHDIITFWLFNTVVKGLFHHDGIPWENTIISGWALDPQGKKMSKSKGNVVEPRDVIEKYSADGLRLWAAGSKLGEDLPYKEKDLVTAKRFLTKMWNASRFALPHLEDFDGTKPEELHPTDAWILAKMEGVVGEATALFEEYKYSKVKKLVTNFFLHDFCDNYLEMCKFRLYNPEKHGEERRKSAQFALYTVLLNSLKMMAPFIPFITEEIYQGYFREREGYKSIHVSAWPAPDPELVPEGAEEAGDIVASVVSAIRRYKADKGMALNAVLHEVEIYPPEDLEGVLQGGIDTISGTMNIEDLSINTGEVSTEEKITEITPDYSRIGPEFKGDAKTVAEYLKGADGQEVESALSKDGEFSFEAGGKTFVIRPEHIKEMKREVLLGGKKVDVMEVEGTGIKVMVKD